MRHGHKNKLISGQVDQISLFGHKYGHFSGHATRVRQKEVRKKPPAMLKASLWSQQGLNL